MQIQDHNRRLNGFEGTWASRVSEFFGLRSAKLQDIEFAYDLGLDLSTRMSVPRPGTQLRGPKAS